MKNKSLLVSQEHIKKELRRYELKAITSHTYGGGEQQLDEYSRVGNAFYEHMLKLTLYGLIKFSESKYKTYELHTFLEERGYSY